MARVTGAELLRQMRELAGAVTFSVGSSPSICHISSQGPAWDAWQAGRYQRGEISQRPGYAGNPFRPR